MRIISNLIQEKKKEKHIINLINNHNSGKCKLGTKSNRASSILGCVAHGEMVVICITDLFPIENKFNAQKSCTVRIGYLNANEYMYICLVVGSSEPDQDADNKDNNTNVCLSPLKVHFQCLRHLTRWPFFSIRGNCFDHYQRLIGRATHKNNAFYNSARLCIYRRTHGRLRSRWASL